MTNNFDPLKIALIGEAGSGKDYIAMMLRLHYGFTSVAFADPVRAIAHDYHPDRYGDGTKKDRQLLIDIGMSHRAIDADVWVHYMANRIYGMTRDVVVTDARLPNEFDFLREDGFIFVRVHAPVYIRMARMKARGDVAQDAALSHVTERMYDTVKCDYDVFNGSDDPKGLFVQLDELIRGLTE